MKFRPCTLNRPKWLSSRIIVQIWYFISTSDCFRLIGELWRPIYWFQKTSWKKQKTSWKQKLSFSPDHCNYIFTSHIFTVFSLSYGAVGCLLKIMSHYLMVLLCLWGSMLNRNCTMIKTAFWLQNNFQNNSSTAKKNLVLVISLEGKHPPNLSLQDIQMQP